MEINWEDFETTLYHLTVAELATLSTRYKGEPFYGFAFDCNSTNGDILLSLNTISGLKQRALQMADPDDPQKKAWAEIDERLEKRFREITGKDIPWNPQREIKDCAYYEQQIKWGVGEWKFMGFQSRKFEKAWAPYQDVIETAWIEASDEPNPISEKFMRSSCRVMIRLENAREFDILPKTPDFKTWVGDHDESDKEARARLEAERRLFTG